jgi:hypothetical protein
MAVTEAPKTGEGTKRELAKATTVATAVAEFYGTPLSDFFVAGHEHEGLTRGSVSVAWEGGVYDWPYQWSQTGAAREVENLLGVWFEAINGCILAVHPQN